MKRAVQPEPQAPPTHPDSAGTGHAEIEAYYRRIAPFYDAETTDRGDLDFWRAVGQRSRSAGNACQ